ncbi:diguanylate cyclase [Actibacterium sp. 188UL27-1]|uniref:diguanylate cyclase n=1 Tax=Actibacterium sp. 188UL27-1 TaxID=2786961 RepID=UPI001957D2BC|nr:diguanylate cyclase [Actibacterium sp. 188UL27-1]MBM7069323.1 diguanylate cyclase [Actibacterium sp. 188UL27-1]
MAGRVLIVEQVATNRIILKVKLASACYDVLQASTGAEALEIARSEKPDLIVLDMHLPDIKGLEVCRALKDNPSTSDIPIVMAGMEMSPEIKLSALRVGAEEYMCKPLNDMTLMARLRSVLRNRDIAQELSLRKGTTQALGFQEEPQAFETPGTIALITEDTHVSLEWRNALKDRVIHRRLIMTRSGALRDLPEERLPDVFVIRTDLKRTRDGLHLLSELRSRPGLRNARTVIVVPEGAESEAAMALDLGASDVVFEPLNYDELAHRLRIHMARKRQADQLRRSVKDGLRMAVTDGLTGLYNRRYALSHLDEIYERACETHRRFAVMVLDLDRFKLVNDKHGHRAGDEVLQEVSNRLQENLRCVDLVARVGGEEFLVVMPDTSAKQAKIAAERLCEIIQENPIRITQTNDRQGTIDIDQTVSIGVAIFDGAQAMPGPTKPKIADLLDRADAALYRAKSAGRNQVTFSKSAA